MSFEDNFLEISEQILNSEFKARSYINLYINDKYIDFFKKVYNIYPSILNSINTSPNIINYIIFSDSVEIVKFLEEKNINYDRDFLISNIKLYNKNKLYNLNKLLEYYLLK